MQEVLLLYFRKSCKGVSSIPVETGVLVTVCRKPCPAESSVWSYRETWQHSDLSRDPCGPAQKTTRQNPGSSQKQPTGNLMRADFWEWIRTETIIVCALRKRCLLIYSHKTVWSWTMRSHSNPGKQGWGQTNAVVWGQGEWQEILRTENQYVVTYWSLG